ncbi:hypothetical protein EYF80_008901 [Liparis tanakae]|uniref:Uncharacterized protein n=1 Tax=Liparis tanakae TaxID=230148 RepID=A0A4Z2ISQ9_9TELE|nr:hypothetical protein EYF80_008901 [Liparis tanakae]
MSVVGSPPVCSPVIQLVKEALLSRCTGPGYYGRTRSSPGTERASLNKHSVREYVLRLCCVHAAYMEREPHTHHGTPGHAKADLEMRNDPPLAKRCCMGSQRHGGGSGQIQFKELLSLLL